MRPILAVLIALAILGMGVPILAADAGIPVGSSLEEATGSAPAAADVDTSIAGEPTSLPGAIDKGKQVIEFAKAKNWLGMSSVIILLLMYAFKTLRKKFFPSLKKRWLYIVMGALGIVSMLLAKFAGGISWEAAWLVLTSAPCAAAFNDILKRGILGKEPSTGGG
jgi:hypothetical protein